jgi:hypothetical protein
MEMAWIQIRKSSITSSSIECRAFLMAAQNANAPAVLQAKPGSEGVTIDTYITGRKGGN